MDNPTDTVPPAVGQPARGSIRSTLKGGSLLYFGQVFGLALSFPVAMMSTAALGPANYGRWGAALALASLIKSFVSFETSQPLTRFLLASRQHGQVERSLALVSSALGCDLLTFTAALGLTAAASLLTAHAGGSPQERLAAVLAATGLLLQYTDRTFLSVARDAHRFGLMALYALLWPLLQVLSIWLLRHFGYLNLVTLAASFAATSGLTMLGQLNGLRRLVPVYGFGLRQISWRSAWQQRRELAEFWGFMGQLYLSTTLVAVVAGADMLILRWTAGPEQTGYYKVAKQLSAVLYGPTAAMTTICYQHINEYMSSGRYALLRSWLRRLLIFWVPLYGGSIALLALLLPWLIQSLFGPAYAAAAPASQVLALGAGQGGMVFYALAIVQLGGEWGKILRALAVTAPAALGLMVLGAEYAGALGVALALVFFNASNNTYALFLALRILRKPDGIGLAVPCSNHRERA